MKLQAEVHVVLIKKMDSTVVMEVTACRSVLKTHTI